MHGCYLGSLCVGGPFFEQKLEIERCMQVKTEMKRKVRKEPVGGSKKRREVGNASPLVIDKD